MINEFVVPWSLILDYFRDCRERTIVDLSAAKDEREMFQAQGKLALLNEFLQLRDILATLDSVGKE